MLPFILGGIALAATGYGIKEYFDAQTCTNEADREEDREVDVPSDTSESDVMEQILTEIEALQREIEEQFDVATDRIGELLKQLDCSES